jgi:hypothetical protein
MDTIRSGGIDQRAQAVTDEMNPLGVMAVTRLSLPV